MPPSEASSINLAFRRVWSEWSCVGLGEVVRTREMTLGHFTVKKALTWSKMSAACTYVIPSFRFELVASRFGFIRAMKCISESK